MPPAAHFLSYQRIEKHISTPPIARPKTPFPSPDKQIVVGCKRQIFSALNWTIWTDKIFKSNCKITFLIQNKEKKKWSNHPVDGRDRMGATSFCRDRMGATSFCCDSVEENTTPREGSRPYGSNLFLRGRDRMGATSFCCDGATSAIRPDSNTGRHSKKQKSPKSNLTNLTFDIWPQKRVGPCLPSVTFFPS